MCYGHETPEIPCASDASVPGLTTSRGSASGSSHSGTSHSDKSADNNGSVTYSIVTLESGSSNSFGRDHSTVAGTKKSEETMTVTVIHNSED